MPRVSTALPEGVIITEPRPGVTWLEVSHVGTSPRDQRTKMWAGVAAICGVFVVPLIILIAGSALREQRGLYLATLVLVAAIALALIWFGVGALLIEAVRRLQPCDIEIGAEALWFGERGQWLKVPADDIRGLVIRTDGRQPVFSKAAQLSEETTTDGAFGSLLMRVSGGWLRVLADRPVSSLRFVADRIDATLRLEGAETSHVQEDGPTVTASHLTRPVWLVVEIIGIVGLGVGVWMFLRDVQPAVTSTRWPTVSAEVTESVYEAGGRGEPLTLALRYRYTVDGIEYHGGGAGIMIESDDDRAQNLVARNPVGSTIEVHYNPAHPAQSTAITGGDTLLIVLIFSVLLFSGSMSLFTPLLAPTAAQDKLWRRYYDREKTKAEARLAERRRLERYR